MTVRRARDITLLVGLLLIGLVTLTMVLRDVDPVEITATVAFAPVFVAFLFFGWKAGLATGALAAAGYVAMRWSAISVVGFGPLFGMISSRVIGYLVFGGVGGWAAEQLQAAIDKLELHDEIDDATGLGNARAAVSAIDVERARAERYEKVVSVIQCSFDLPAVVSDRIVASTLRQLGAAIAHSVRASDRAAHIDDTGGRHHLLIVLPETGAVGAETVATNLDREVRARIGTSTNVAVMTLPGDEDRIEGLLESLAPLV
jgi:GGDEF domain-containing protein